MNDDQLNRAIHEWMGRGHYHIATEVASEENYRNWRCEDCGQRWIISLPQNSSDYCSDHNAVREFFSRMGEYAQTQTVERLCEILGLDDERGFDDLDAIKFIQTSPRQLAEAGAKAVGIYETNTNR